MQTKLTDKTINDMEYDCVTLLSDDNEVLISSSELREYVNRNVQRYVEFLERKQKSNSEQLTIENVMPDELKAIVEG